jgi:hypothetical protein
VRGGDVATHIHLDTGNNLYFDQYFGDDVKYVKLEAAGDVVIQSNNGTMTSKWTFGASGNITLPVYGDILDSTGTSVLLRTYREAGHQGSGLGYGGEWAQADSLVIAGLNPTENILSTYGGDLILTGGYGGPSNDQFGEVRIKGGTGNWNTPGSNFEWRFTSDKKIKLPSGGDIVDSTGATAFVSLATLKQVVADSTDFADFQSRIAGM